MQNIVEMRANMYILKHYQSTGQVRRLVCPPQKRRNINGFEEKYYISSGNQSAVTDICVILSPSVKKSQGTEQLGKGWRGISYKNED